MVIPRLLGVLYATRPILVPVLVALALAYVFNPLVTWMKDRLRISRWVGTLSIMGVVLAATMLVGLLVVPPLVNQTGELMEKAQQVYPQVLKALNAEVEKSQEITGTNEVASEAPPEAPIDAEIAADVGSEIDAELADEPSAVESQDESWIEWLFAHERMVDYRQTLATKLTEVDAERVAGLLAQSLDIGVGVVGSAISFGSYLALASVIIVFCFFMFSWKFEGIRGWLHPYIPQAYRERTLDIVGRMDKSVSAFIRGRLIQATVIAIVLTTGWWFFEVPYFLLLGVAGGVLNLIPYAAFFVWPVAILLAYLDSLSGGAASAASTGFDWMAVLVWPSVVYFIAQSLDGWIVEPLVQGQATDLDPLTVMLVVLLGGTVAGLLGMMLAIPIAACVKILLSEVVLPKWRQWAAEH